MVESASSEGTTAASFDVGHALTFFFEDPDWIRKLLVGSLFAVLSPLIIGAVFMTGYAVALARNVRDGKSPALPEWDNLSELFTEGLRGFVIALAHKLPVILLGVLLLFAIMGSVLLGRESAASPEGLVFFGIPAIFGGFLVVFLLSLALLVYVPAAFVRFVRTNRLAAAFDFMDNVDFIREHRSSYLMAVLVIVLAAMVAQMGFVVLCIGVFPATFWSMCVMGYVIGELAKLPDAPASSEVTTS